MFEEKKLLWAKQETLKDRKMVFHRSLFTYLYDLLTHTSLYTKIHTATKYFRRFRAVSFTIKLLSILFTILETGALVLLSTIVFLIILPIAAALMLGFLITALLEAGKVNRRLSTELADQKIYVLFLRDTSKNRFLMQNARELATHGTVLLVSPYWISSRGLYPRGFYCTVRWETSHILLVRRYYYFSLRNHVLKKLETAYLY